MVTDWSRGSYVRPPHWQPERGAADHLPEPTPIRPPPDTIHNALRERCHLPVKSYFCAVIMDDDQVAIFSGPEILPAETIPKFFFESRFKQIFQRRSAQASYPVHEDAGFPFADPHYYGDGETGRRRMDRRRDPMNSRLDRLDDEMLPQYHTRKRQKATHRRVHDDDEAPAPISRLKKKILVGDSDVIWDFYGQRFKGIQQNACKLIAKAWVKAVAPKKQTNNPYTAGDEKAPDWWPKPWGTAKEDRVRHIEPDHLLKKERVHLLIHILRMIVEPNESQHPDIQKLNINVAKLEEVTNDALSSFFSDNDKNNNLKKKPYITEIFKMAKAEEQYKRGEIDASTGIYVMAEDKIPDHYPTDDEKARLSKDDEERDSFDHHPERIPPPRNAGAHSVMPVSSSVHSPVTSLQGPPFMGEIPLRGSQYPASMMASDMAGGQHSYVESGNMGVASHMQDMMPGPHDTGRRPSLYNAQATEFPSPTGSGLYTNTWQASTAPGPGSFYPLSPQQPQPQQSNFVSQPGVSLTQTPSYLSSPFAGLPQPQQLPDVYRSSPVSQGHGQGYQYMGHDGRSIPHGLKMEPTNRGALHQ